MDALIKMNLTAEEQAEQVRADLDPRNQRTKPKTRTLRHDDDIEAVVGKLRALYDDDLLRAIREAIQ